MTIRTRMPALWALLVGHDADAEEREKAAAIRAQALADLQQAKLRRDTRKQNERLKKAIAATSEALRSGA